jgi:hypothetical protein
MLSKKLFLIHAVGALVAFLPMTESKTCLLLYEVAGSHLEYWLRQDYEELLRLRC